MVRIAPFRALRYKSQNLGAVTTPPHDVISPAEQEAFLQNANNICHAILPAGDDGTAHAAQAMADWQAKGVMHRDPKPALYRYTIRHDGGLMSGFFCRLALDPTYTEIKRHEKTLPKKRSTRLDLLRATKTNTESIWMLYRDERGWVDEVLSSNATDEVARFTDEDGNEHRVWRIERDEAVQEVMAQFDDRGVVIADGHHRYATQLKYWEETGRDEDGSLLVCMVRDTDPGVFVRPTDRLIRKLDRPVEEALVVPGWTATEIDGSGTDGELAKRIRAGITSPNHFGIVGPGPRAWILQREPPTTHDPLLRLAVTAVHEFLEAWGCTADNVEETLGYTRDDEEAVAAVRSGAVPAAVFPAPEPVEAVLDVASSGQVMPQKSTYFVPKLRSGLVLSPLDEPMPTGWQGQVTDAGKADFRMPPLD